MIDGPRLTVSEMKRRDWWLLGESLPEEEACNELQRALLWFSWGEGWQRLEGLPGDESGRRYLRQIWKGLAGRPYRAGPFRVERFGRWGIAFVIDPAYAAQRTRRRRSREHGSGPGGWDAMFERLHDQEVERRFADRYTESSEPDVGPPNLPSV